MKKVIWIVLLVVLLGVAGFLAFLHVATRSPMERSQIQQAQQTQQAQKTPELQAAPREESFDNPLRKTVVDLGAAPNVSPVEHSALSCYFFNGFMVKELDLKELGDEWIAIVPASGSKVPPCVQEHGQGEMVIQGWTGYYDGVKGNLVFLNAEDGFNGGYPFGVFDPATGKKLFEDSRELADRELHFASDEKRTALRYRRIHVAECSIPEQKDACWKQIEQKTGLSSQPMPACTGYGGNIDETDPSVVSYPVEVTLPGFNLRMLPGPVKCWAAD